MTTARFLLRCLEIGLSVQDLELITIGTVSDMYSVMNSSTNRKETSNYRAAEQADFDAF